MTSRSSFDGNSHFRQDNRHPTNSRGGFSTGGGGGGQYQHHHVASTPPYHPHGGADGGGEFRPRFGGFGGNGGSNPMPLSGQKRGFSFSESGGFHQDKTGGGGFAKLFVGSVPTTITEEDIRPLFKEHGNLIEVALIKDKRTGQQQGCCFIKYATSEDADRAIRALHNQYTLPGGVGPIQVRYADGERERLGNGTVEHKLFVGSLNKHATTKEIEEIFAPYGRVEDVYIMRDELKQSRGCGFVTFSQRDMAVAAMNALSGIYLMRGCDQPLIVRFADPKKPRPGDSRGAPAFGPRSQVTSSFRPASNLVDPIRSSDATAHDFGVKLVPSGGVSPVLSATSGPLGGFGGPSNGFRPALAPLPSISQQSFNPSMLKAPTPGQQISPLQKPLQSSPDLLAPIQLQPHHTPISYPQTQTSLPSTLSSEQIQISNSAARSSTNQALPPQRIFNSSGQVSVSHPQVQQNASATQHPIPLNQQEGSLSTADQQHMPVPAIQQQLHQPSQQSPSQLAQMLSQQREALQASFQSSQQAFSQLQQQLHMMQQSGQSLNQQSSSQPGKQQSTWTGSIEQGHADARTVATAAAVPAPSTTSAPPTAPAVQGAAPPTCNWTEHISPEGFKYYHNSITSESRWEKPEELTLFEQQQRQQEQKLQHQHEPPVQQLHSQAQTQTHPHVLSTRQVSQTQQNFQPQMRQQQQLLFQQPSLSSAVSGHVGHQNALEPGFARAQALASSGADLARVRQQGPQAAQEWMWKNKPTGA